MRASVIVGAHNEGERLWKTVDSIFDSSPRLDFELIVANDASSDDSINEAQHRFPRIIIVSHKKREGVAATRVLAAGHARGDVLIFLDGHTRPEPGSLERLVQDVEASGGNAVITPQIVGLDEGTWQVLPHQTGNGYAMDLETFDSWWISLKKMKEVKLGKHTLYESPAFVGCAVAIDRKLYDRAWGFDAHMRSWGNEDLDLALKVWTLGGRVLHDPSAVVAHRFQSFFENYTVSAEYPLANHIRSARKHFTQSMWEDWLERAQQRNTKKLWGHPEGIWARAWEVFQQDRQSAEHERAYLLGRREKDEFWYATRFERNWPTTNSISLAPPKKTNLPSKLQFAQVLATAAPPHIDSINPDNGNQGDTVDVVLSGSFKGGGTINSIPGIGVEDQDFVDQTTIDGTFAIASNAAVGGVSVTVTNESGVMSNAVTFTINAGPPNVQSVDPDNACVGTAGNMTITGSGFTGATVTSGDGLDLSNVTVQGDSSITANYSVEDLATPGPIEIIVQSDYGSDSGDFTINGMTVTSIDPDSGCLGKNVNVTIGGTCFINVAVTAPSGITVSNVETVSPTQVTATLDLSSTASNGVNDITIKNNRGDGASDTANFTVLGVTAINPDSGCEGTSVAARISGYGLAGATPSGPSGITFSNINNSSNTSLTATMAISSSAPVGQVDITLAMANGCSDTAEFTVNQQYIITSQTVATQPSNRTRTTIGIGEVVNLTFAGTTATWLLQGPGTLTPNGKTATYTASATTGRVVIQATAPNGCSSAAVFTVIAPSAVNDQYQSLLHTQGDANIGMCAGVYIGPDTVNFGAVYIREVNEGATASGCWACINGQCHCLTCASTYCNSVHASSTVTSGYGTLVGVDTIYSGYCGSNTSPGSVSFTIPVQYSLDNSTWVQFFTESQVHTLNGVNLSASKCGASTPATTISSPSGTGTCLT
jgi:GT2 family glycosyltransferase